VDVVFSLIQKDALYSYVLEALRRDKAGDQHTDGD
jgi:hypothetical protein